MSNEESPAKGNYRNPPVEHRFRKGVSGNPKGRPRKNRGFASPRALVSTKGDGQLGVGPEDPMKSLAIEEAYRLITVREGDRVEKIPVIQAILRKVLVAAANGNVRAQQQFLNLVIGAEADRRVATMEMFNSAIEYKERWHHALSERARNGTTGPEPVPHPDDIIIDPKTWEVRFEGPVLQEEKDAQDALHAMWPDFERDLSRLNEMIEADPGNPDLREQRVQLTKIVDWIWEDKKKRSLKKAVRERMTKKPSMR